MSQAFNFCFQMVKNLTSLDDLVGLMHNLGVAIREA